MDSNRIKTLVELMGQGASDAVCLAAADAAPLTYAKLRQLASYVMSMLNESGIGRENRVAIVMPNGPMMATSGRLMTGVCATPPSGPSEVSVMVEPDSSSLLAVPLRAASARRAISAANCHRFLSWASRITGTISPESV